MEPEKILPVTVQTLDDTQRKKDQDRRPVNEEPVLGGAAVSNHKVTEIRWVDRKKK